MNDKAPSDMFFESEIRPEQNGRLLLDALKERFTYHSEDDWREKLRDGFVKINGEIANENTIAHTKDKVIYHVAHYTEPEVPTHFETVFEDDEFLLVNKPAGVPVHHTGRIFYNTFVSIVRRKSGYETATPLHRLDRDTGGLMLFAKYAETATRFQKNLDKILLQKFYIALVWGEFPYEEFYCKYPLRENENDDIRLRMHHFEDGKKCETNFKKIKVLEKNSQKISLIEAELITGRKHQIRAHLKELGYPIVGDKLYSFDGTFYKKMSSGIPLTEEDFKILGARTQMLHAYRVVLKLPYWKEPREFQSNLDENFCV